ncbi:MAG: right-handed parallel beta-helix repeat-containing protein [Bacillota bacterium]|nr:right-handed parallel beta-helix repeat-containing protein [Bacillota bacterium]
MINYEQFNITDDHSTNIRKALEYCKEHKADGLIFNKGIYDLYDDFASEKFYTMSNHGFNNLKRIGFLLEGMENFTIDGGGSEFVAHNCLMTFVVEKCKNITLKNFSIYMEHTMLLFGKVTAVDETGFNVEVLNGQPYYIEGNVLRFNELGYDLKYSYHMARSKEGSHNFEPYSRCFFDKDLSFTDLGKDKFRVENSKAHFELNDYCIFAPLCRHTSDIYLKSSNDTLIENVTLHRSKTMGVIAEKCENITIDHLIVTPKEGEYFSLNQDATHFIHCKGLVEVKNSLFEEQLDDALNIHGIFTRIVKVEKNYIIVKYMHYGAKGLNIYDKGSRFQVLNPKTLIPYGKYTIKDVEVINIDYTKIYVEGGTEGIIEGDDIEDITWVCDLKFTNNIVRNNRARGILIAAGGNVFIDHNYFSTPGTAILFESDGQYWFESGGTNHVAIENNTFENCKLCNIGWGTAVIEVKPREEFDGEHYYHKYIQVTNNTFKSNNARLVLADNIEKFVFKDNIIEKQQYGIGKILNCGEVDTDF